MTQRHNEQIGTFHITTNTKDRMPWCTIPGIPEIIIEDVCVARDLYKAELFAFSILPNHVHMLIRPGPAGLSKFLQSFKSNTSRNIRRTERSGEHVLSATEVIFNGWQKGFYDERIQSSRQWSNARHYIECNAYKHRLVEHPMDWPWTSLHYPNLVNPAELE